MIKTSHNITIENNEIQMNQNTETNLTQTQETNKIKSRNTLTPNCETTDSGLESILTSFMDGTNKIIY